MSKKHQHFEQWRIPGTQLRLKRKPQEFILPTPSEEELYAHATRDTPPVSSPNLDDRVRPALLGGTP